MPSFKERLQEAVGPRYLIGEEIGGGGMGVVYRAHDTRLDCAVAVKTLRPEQATASAVERFRFEARTLANHRHPNIVPIHDYDSRDGIDFFVMALLEGETVGEELEDEAGVLGAGPEIPHWLEEVANKPADELEIDGGEPVMLGHTGKKLGEVKDVLFDGDGLVGIVLKPEGLFKKEVILPRRFLDRSDDAALFAKLDEADLEHLKPFAPEE